MSIKPTNSPKQNRPGKLTIEFSGEALSRIDIHIPAGEDNRACLSPEDLMLLLLRITSTCLILSGNNMQEVLANACRVGSCLADEIEKFKRGDYVVKIHLPEASTIPESKGDA